MARIFPQPAATRSMYGVLPIKSVLTRAEVDRIAQKYDPKAVVPAHYFPNGFTSPVSGLEWADEWVKDQEKLCPSDVRRLDRAVTLHAAELRGSHHRVYYFGNHFEKN